MESKFGTALLAATMATGILATKATAAPFTLDVIGSIVAETGDWANLGQSFSSTQTFDDDLSTADVIQYFDATENLVAERGTDGILRDAGGNPIAGLPGTATLSRWWFEGAPYGVNYTGDFLAAPLSSSLVWIETLDNFDADAAGNPFGVTGVVDAVVVSGGNVIAICPGEDDPITGCPPDAPNSTGMEFSIVVVAMSNWFDGFNVSPSTDPAEKLLGIFGQGVLFEGSDTPSATVEIVFDIEPVPLPAALPMLAGGLGLLGLFGWRRKRASA